MKICYVDESGCTGALSAPSSPVQPVFVLGGLIVDESTLPSLCQNFLGVKKRFFPNEVASCRRYLDRVLVEIKGSDLRRAFRRRSRRNQNRARRFLSVLLSVLENHDAKLVGSVWIKPIGGTGSSTGLYTSSVQMLCGSFQSYLGMAQEHGFVVADRRSIAKDANLSHSIFTQKFKRDGDGYDRLVELPTFGNSRNHVGLQICDLVCSAIVWPIAVVSYCPGHVSSIHVDQGYRALKREFAARLMRLQYRYQDGVGRWRGGLRVTDGLGKRPGSLLFKSAPSPSPAQATV